MTICIFDYPSRTFYSDSKITRGYAIIDRPRKKLFKINDDITCAGCGVISQIDSMMFELKQVSWTDDIQNDLLNFKPNSNVDDIGILIYSKIQDRLFRIDLENNNKISIMEHFDTVIMSCAEMTAEIIMKEMNLSAPEVIKTMSKYNYGIDDKIQIMKG